MSYVLYFSKPFALAIAIWPFLSLLLTLPVLALLYHRDNRLRFTSALTAYLVVLYLIALACFTMYPMPENPATYCAAHHLRPQLNPFEIRTTSVWKTRDPNTSGWWWNVTPGRANATC